MPFSIKEARVAIVGLGLMGGSLAAALKSEAICAEVIGIARRESTLATARMLRFIDWGTDDLAQGVAEADVVMLATPVRDILDKVASIGDLLKPGCLLMDVGSTKQAICEAMQSLPDHVQPIGGHPMCGKEKSGIRMAEPDLYQDQVFALVPLERTSKQALHLAESLVEGIGARPLLLDAARHDAIVAAISHLPYMAAVALVRAAEALGEEEPLLWELAASGFRDTSRVAAGSIPMMMDILMTNRASVLCAVQKMRQELDELGKLLEESQDEQLQELLQRARQRRLEVYR